MKRATFASAFIIILALLWAFEGFIPASEMSGSYFKMSTYYQKIFDDFDGGIDNMGLMVSSPLLYRNFSLEADFTSWGDDDVWKEMQFNLSPGYQVNSWLTAAVSGGFFRRAVDEGGTNFNEPEILENDEMSVLTLGASLHGSFFEDRLQIGLGLFNLNEPDIAMTGAGEETLPMKVLADVGWQVSRNVNLGGFYIHDDNEDYYGVKFGLSIPNDIFTTNVWTSAERLTVAPQFNTLNYWDVMFAYDYHYEEDISGFNNYGVYVSYELPPATIPEIIFADERFDEGYFETLEVTEPIDFIITGQERFEHVYVDINNQSVIRQKGLRDYRGEPFRGQLELEPGNNDVSVRVQGVRGEETEKVVRIVRLEPEIVLDVLPDTVWQDEWYDVVWMSPLKDASYYITLLDEDGGETLLTAEAIESWEAREGLVKAYRYAWLAGQVEADMAYRLRVQDMNSRIFTEGLPFIGAVAEPVIVDTVDYEALEAARLAAEQERLRLEAQARAREIERKRRFIKVDRVPGVITNEDAVSITWMSKVKSGSFRVWLYQDDTMLRELTSEAVTRSQRTDDWEQFYAWMWTAEGLEKNVTYRFRVAEDRTGVEDYTNPFRGDVIPPPPPPPEPEPEPEPKGFPLWAGILIGVGVVGGALWFFFARKTPVA
ncbi:MAG: hypothetical protein K8R90_07135 [Candidatus Cloacimonetes bacterium]|nr:hypothetical protein [Candidatus Cloacimonadota bacterium]